MSFNNGPYIFSEVPGYETSKGERIMKAFRKLWAKINHLEQAKILEKNTRSQEVQTISDSDLSVNDIKYEILLTQLRYIIKTVREYGNEEPLNPLQKGCCEATTGHKPASSSNSFKSVHESPDVEVQKDEQSCTSVSKIPMEPSRNEERERDVVDHQVSTTGTQTSNKDTTEKLSQNHSKQDSHSHYHLKLNDVPFILGASASASHSVVANVQNIIALMKNHNKALCASKPQTQKEVIATKTNKPDTQDTNKMIRQLSEDLSQLTMKQEKLKAMLDNASSQSSDTKVEISRHNKAEGNKKCEIPEHAGGIKQNPSTDAFQKNSKQPSKKRAEAKSGNQEKHVVPTVRMQTNENPQLARRKMLRTLKDFKTHLSEEDLSWK